MGAPIKYFETLAGKLILTVGVLLFGGSLVFGFIYFKFQERVMLGNIESQARLSANLVLMGLEHGMMSGDREFIQLSVDAMGATRYVHAVHIYNTSGVLMHATDRTEVGLPAPEGSDVYAYLAGRTPPPRISRTDTGEQVLEFLTPIHNKPTCAAAACHAHPSTQRMLGVLATDFGTAAIATTERQMFVGTLIFGGVFVLCISVFLFLIFYKFVSRPVTTLQEGMMRLAKGDLEQPLEVGSRDEIGHLAETFNSMAYDIRRYRERLENWTKELQEEVERKTGEIMKAQEQLVDAEKLASLGRLAAGVAHELNNPLTGIVTFAHLLRDRLPEENAQDREDVDLIIEQADKCSTIIKGLLGFARKGTSEKLALNVNDIIESSISMVRNQSKFYNVRISLELAPQLPAVTADPNQIQQVILNIFTNAADAMNDVGEMHIGTGTVTEGGRTYVEMSFSDNGPGILPEHLSRIFEPFFTTKPVGKGTGLGLPVSYGIIKRHGGDIVVRSKVGKGTSFMVRLPVAGERDPGKEART